MKAQIYLLALLLIVGLNLQAQKSGELNDRYLKVPIYSNIEEVNDKIPSPTEGMIIYNNYSHSFWYFNGVNWIDMATSINIPLVLTSNGAALVARTQGSTGTAGDFTNFEPSNTSPTVSIYNNGAGTALDVTSDGNGDLANFKTSYGSTNKGVTIKGYGSGTPLEVRQEDNTTPATVFYTPFGSSAPSILIWNYGTGKAISSHAPNGTAGYFTSTNSYALITGDGNTGLGIPNPSEKLVVNGNSKILGNTSTNGYTQLGLNSPAIMIKTISNTTLATNGAKIINHGIAQHYKILNVSIFVTDIYNSLIPPNQNIDAVRYNYWITPNSIYLENNTSGSCNICGRHVDITITYKE